MIAFFQLFSLAESGFFLDKISRVKYITANDPSSGIKDRGECRFENLGKKFSRIVFNK